MTRRDRLAGAVISNAALSDSSFPADPTFLMWRDEISQTIEKFSTVLGFAAPSEPTEAELAAYDAPYPSDEYTAGPRQLPAEIPFDAALPEAAINRRVLEQWAESDLPLLTIFSDPNPDDMTATPTSPVDPETFTWIQKLVIDSSPGAIGQSHVNLASETAAHFISEDIPDEVTEHLLAFLGTVKPGR